MSDKNTGGPAFPIVTATCTYATGMMLRDHFAGLVVQGLLADLPNSMCGPEWKENAAKSAYEIADYMLKARSA